MAIDSRGFDFGRGVTAEATDFTNLLGRGQQVQAREMALGQQRAQLAREAQVRQALQGIRTPETQPQTQQEQMLAEQSQGLGGAIAQAEQPQPILSQQEKIDIARDIDPAVTNKLLKDAGIDSASKRAEASRFATELEGTPFELRREKIEARSQKLRSEGRDPAHTDQLLDMDEATQNQGLLAVQLMDLSTKERFATKTAAARGAGISVESKAFNDLIKDFTPEEKKTARRVKAGLKGRATGSALQTIAEEGTVQKIAKTKSMIEGAVVEAKIIAKERGETFTSLKQAQAALPGLNSVVDNLRELAPLATSTLGGKLFNAAVKETGFGATKGATARAKFIAIVNNQVLPLLKPTFGAAFTVPEGDALRATMGDPDATPEEKMAQLDAFIAQKMRDIEAKESILEKGQAEQTAAPEAGQQEQNQVIRFDAQGNII